MTVNSVQFLQLGFQLANSPFRHLPFMVIGAVAGGAAGLLFAPEIYPQITHLVVLFIAVLVVYQFVCFQRASKKFGHLETMLCEGLAGSLHRPIQRQIIGRNVVSGYEDVPSTGKSLFPATFPLNPHMVPRPHSVDRAGATESGEIRAPIFFSHLHRRTNADFFAARALNIHNNPGCFQVPGKVRLANKRGVIGKWCEIGFSRHSGPRSRFLTV